ncbi:MAG TPA: roadblock/LC7 domain-containing protein [Candidatus Lokiarchaeia archaeon]|nr:roadblock/LC7 domain-containing protein [Candidatus Lokiarchaeia archaeon]
MQNDSSSNIEELEEILKNLTANIPEILATAVVSVEGLPIASMMPTEIDDTHIAAITAAMLSLGERAALELNKGPMEQILVRGEQGNILVMGAGSNAVLTISTTKDVKLGLIFLDCKRACEKISKIV